MRYSIAVHIQNHLPYIIATSLHVQVYMTIYGCVWCYLGKLWSAAVNRIWPEGRAYFIMHSYPLDISTRKYIYISMYFTTCVCLYMYLHIYVSRSL